MNKDQLEKYARLIVVQGANVQKGQKVRIYSETDQHELATAIAEQAYKAGASFVEMMWTCSKVSRLGFEYAETEVLGTMHPWEHERAKQMTEELPVRIHIDSEDPDRFKGISADKLSDVSRMRSSAMKKYQDAIEGRNQWCIAAAASPEWAAKVFPDLPSDEAVERLWQEIFRCVYLDDGKDLDCWQNHSDTIKEKAAWLNSCGFVSLRYKSANGTDFSVELIPEAKWHGGSDVNMHNGVVFSPNMPTEEIYTSPMKGRCSGRLVSTKPLSWSGQLIENFTVDFADGKVCSCSAEKGEDILKKLFAMDEGAAMLGEVALVPKESPVNQSGLLFMNTLFDENACCHVAVGMGFPEVLDGFEKMTDKERHDKGINDSMIHVDFMIGSDDLEITGIRADGSEEKIFVNGTWA